ncbi:hypothetical protein BSKO_13101 [Bryopsis sp. KO-2023]|nr:hypothetical protein BSKO_13101 [Bryopsis sp. KO-2023]
MSTILSRSEPHGKCVGNHTADSMKRVAESNMLEDDISRLIEQCCNENPSNRPSFPTIISKLSKILEKCRKDSSRSSVQNKQKLLLDIFPEKVAAALSSGRPVEPEPFDCVTIFFSDVVGFTKISSALEAREVMDMLHRLYKAFDSLTTKYGLFKVETIGDAYMVVANLPNPQARHTLRIAQFAIEAVRVAETVPIHKDQSELGFVNIRVGFHSGPVVASVIGTKNPRYCLFGETVNIASRMESSSLPGRIQCSEYSATLLKCQSPEIELEERGSHHVKGLGMTNTYWVRF